MQNPPPLKPLHLESSLSNLKLTKFDLLSSDQLKDSLLPGNKDCLKAKPDGTLLDGHHRIVILRPRGVDVNLLPREIVDSSADNP